MKKAIIYTVGRFGNQLFQYSFGLRLLEENVVDKFYINNTKNNFPLTLSSIVYQVITDEKSIKKNTNFIQKIMFFLFKHQILNNKSLKRFYIFSNFGFLFYSGYENINFKKLKKRNYICSGFFENHCIIDPIHKQLISSCILQKKDDPSFIQLIDKIQNSDSVCISVRRGDFLEIENLNICDIEYFQKAINIIASKLEKPSFFVFSDDIEWCKAQRIFNGFYFENPANDLSNKLFLMSHCKHFILSNSTFSFWGWALSFNDKNKIVISPKSFDKAFSKTSLIYPDWILI